MFPLQPLGSLGVVHVLEIQADHTGAPFRGLRPNQTDPGEFPQAVQKPAGQLPVVLRHCREAHLFKKGQGCLQAVDPRYVGGAGLKPVRQIGRLPLRVE